MMESQSRASFGNAAVRALFGTSLLMVIVTYVSTICSTVIAGKVVGNVALCAVNLVTPLYSYATFFSGMIGIGSSLLYFRYLGAYQKERADEIFSQGILLALAVGFLLLAAMTLGKNAYLDRLGVSATIRAEVEAFWRFEKYLIALAPVDFLLFELLYTDIRVSVSANIVFFVFGIGSSLLLTKLYGTAGASLGMVIGTIACDLVLCSHFLGKKNSFSFCPHFSWQDLKEMCRLSLVDSSTYLDSGILVVFINNYVLHHFSEQMLSVTAVMVTVLEIVVVFDSVGSAFAPVAEMYLGEDNNQDEKGVARFSLALAAVFGLLVTVIFLLIAPLIPGFMGLEDAALVESAVRAIRLFAPSMLFYSLSYMLISQYIAVRRITIAVVYEWTKALFMPVLCILLFGKLFGFAGIWGGFIPAELLSVLGFAAGVRLFAAKEESIWLLGENQVPTFSRSWWLTEETVIGARDAVEKFLSENQVPQSVIYKVILTVEEMTNLLLSVNPHGKVIVQYTVSLRDDCIFVYERDNGAIYDLADPDRGLKSFQEYIFSCILDFSQYKRYLVTIDYNRSVFRYELPRSDCAEAAKC